MESLKAKFPELTFWPLQKPEFHADFEYDPLNPSTRVLNVGYSKAPGRRRFTVECLQEKDVAVEMRDKTKVYLDIFRPVSSDGPHKVPAVFAWSPYGKSGGGQRYENMGPFRCGVPLEQTSGYEKFEGPDPADWCARGYAIINIDVRGSGDSGGDISFWGEQEALDAYDTIDWASKQPWCNGSVAFAGNSWLSIAQLNLASRITHPALKALAPWEAATDPYKDLLCRGGVPRAAFLKMIYNTLAGQNGIENMADMAGSHPLYDGYWSSKHVHVENIDVPLYLTASYSSGLHSNASFDTFKRAKTTEKWLRVHPYQEWSDLYRPEVNDELQAFFDKYCKGLDTKWEDTPKFRFSLVGFEGSPVGNILERTEADWPIPNTEYRKYFLDSGNHSMSTTKPENQAKTSHESHHMTACSDFTVKFDRYTELGGYPAVKLWMSCDEHDEMDVFVQVRKVSKDGSLMTSLNYKCPVPEPQVPSTNIAKFLGPDGMLRASHRVSKRQTGDFVSYTHDKTEKLIPGTIVELEIPIWPIGMVFDEGEGILLRVAGHDLRLPEVDGLTMKEPLDENFGQHWIYTGGEYDSYLIVPVLPERT